MNVHRYEDPDRCNCPKCGAALEVEVAEGVVRAYAASSLDAMRSWIVAADAGELRHERDLALTVGRAWVDAVDDLDRKRKNRIEIGRAMAAAAGGAK